MTYAELLADLAELRQAKSKILLSQEYQVGQGGTARRNVRVKFDELCAEIARIELQIDKHPDNPANAGGNARRIRYLRPMG